MVAFSDWLRDIFTTSAAEKAAADRARADAPRAGSWASTQMSQSVTPRVLPKQQAAYAPNRPRKAPDKGEQTNMLAGSSVQTNKQFYRGSATLPRAAQPDASFYDRTIGAMRENPARLQFTQDAEPGRRGSLRNETITYAPRPAEKKDYGPSDDSFYGRTVGAILKNPPIPTFSGETRGRTVNRGKALDDLAALDAKTSARVDQEFDAEQRVEQLGMTTTLTPEEYAALSPRQQAAVLFNTGLIDAGRADAETGGVDATRDYLARFNITRDEKELSSFLRLDDLVGESILRKLDDLTARHDSASSLRWARGDEKAAGDSAQFLRARGSSDAAAEAISLNLSSTGNPTLSGGTPLAGFGATQRDNVIKFAFTNMADSRGTATWADIVSGLEQLNVNFGTDVSPDEVWQYASAAVNSVDFARAGSREADVYNMTTPADTEYTPLDTVELRRRYGI